MIIQMTGLLLLTATMAFGQSGLDRPQMGVMLDSSGGLRTLFGVPGSLIPGSTATTGALSVACSRRLCLVKTDSAILSSLDATPAPAGPALFALDGEQAFVYFPSSRQLARWFAGQLDFLDIDIPGEVLSLRRGSGDNLDVAARRDDQVLLLSISLKDGGVSATGGLPRGKLVMLLDQGILFSSRDQLILRRVDGSETRFDLRGAETGFLMGDGYVEVRAGRSTYAVRMDPGHEQIFLLPEAVE